MRSLILLTTVVVTQASAAQASFVELTILGEGGTEQVEIGPAGGIVPYSLFAETDPLGTPGNLGLALAAITIDTDTGARQEPVSQFAFPFDQIGKRPGFPDQDDLIDIRAQQLVTWPVPGIPYPGLGQSGPQQFAYGALIVPSAPPGTIFHASILIAPGNADSSRALLFTSESRAVAAPDNVFGNTLTIAVVPEPSTALLAVAAGCVAWPSRLRRRRTGDAMCNAQHAGMALGYAPRAMLSTASRAALEHRPATWRPAEFFSKSPCQIGSRAAYAD